MLKLYKNIFFSMHVFTFHIYKLWKNWFFWHYNGFSVFFIRVGRGFLTPIFYEDPPLLLTSFFKFCPPPSPPTSNTTALFVVLCLWLNGDSATFDVLFYLIIFWIHSCRALVPCYVFYGTRCRVYRGMTHNAVFR